MDTVMDLAARAVSFIILIQDTYARGSSLTNQQDRPALQKIFCADFRKSITAEIRSQRDRLNKAYEDSGANRGNRNNGLPRYTNFESRAVELVWISPRAPHESNAVEYTVDIMSNLVNWICVNSGPLFLRLGDSATLPSPYRWREAISFLVYTDRKYRIELAAALQYLPIHIVLAIGGGALDVVEQRMIQLWKPSEQQLSLLFNAKDQTRYLQLQQDLTHDLGKESIEEFLGSDVRLTAKLRESSPLPFEFVFKSELIEINTARDMRALEQHIEGNRGPVDPETPASVPVSIPAADCETMLDYGDANSIAESMKLYGLAFSGGGIRSATFNLGLLQGLARQGLISQFDYLSTVSGGGYIGSWLAAWIKRDGSVGKVNDRLNPDSSPDPFAEEVRPIRWLRMYSNYFTPQASIMSVDAWTIGVTWLRNTLLNQFIIMQMLVAALLVFRSLYEMWVYDMAWYSTTGAVVVISTGAAALVTAALLTGQAMQAFQHEPLAAVPKKKKMTAFSNTLIVLVTLVCAYFLSAGFFGNPGFEFREYFGIEAKAIVLSIAGVVVLAGLLVIAFVGRYSECIMSHNKSQLRAILEIVLASIASAVVAMACLIGTWELLEYCQSLKTDFWKSVAFIIGVPLVLLSFGITVVTRMALLGRYFPDERREWWGRTGAEISRITLIFVVLGCATQLGMKFFYMAVDNQWIKPLTVGSWVALVGSAVRAGFSGHTTGKNDGKSDGTFDLVLKVLSAAGPYLFILGLLIFLPAVLVPLVQEFLPQHGALEIVVLKYIGIAAVLFASAYLLGRRVGVNEFSMHHFYRNRLVRAYLGATRRRTDRHRTVNPYTNFDRHDDVKLSELITRRGYYGPYPILNTALNASDASSLDRQDRKAESFTFSPLYCGFDFSMTRESANATTKAYDYGFRETRKYAYPNDRGPGIGTAMAISGAAVNPNMGYHSSAGTAFLLTIFNVQMGWWIGNPRKSKWQTADPESGLGYIVANLAGKTSTRENFVCLSDGGHFDNMGLYELVRRRCSFIVLGDSEQDDMFTCEGLANAIRRCRIDFGAEITIDVSEITSRNEQLQSVRNYAIGTIRFSGDKKPTGTLLYIKSSLTGNEPVDVKEYSQKNKTFPHQSTGDQFFDEEQFESYRKLGLHIADNVFREQWVRNALQL